MPEGAVPSLAAALGIKKSDYSVTRCDLRWQGESVQIDLLIDVRGGALYLFEMKFWASPCRLEKRQAQRLAIRREALSHIHRSRRSIIVCLLSAAGVQPSDLVADTVDLTMTDRELFLA